MERFRITLRDQSHTIGVAEPGVLTVTLCSVVRDDPDGGPERECELRLGALDSASGTFIDWPGYDLVAGDRIVIEVLREGEFDDPAATRCDIKEIVRRSKEDGVRHTAKELGWTIIENNTPPES